MFKLIRKKKIKQILQFERDKQEFRDRPKTQKADDFWLKEWYKKCDKINELVK